jgi:uncharacterized protein YkwD
MEAVVANSVSRSRRQVALVFLLAAALLTAGIVTDPVRAGATEPNARAEMFRLTNDDREAKDRHDLDLNAELSRYAKRHSRKMAERGELFHTPDLADKLAGLDWTIGGENVGVGPDLPSLEDAFMASTPHRKNILRRGFYDAAIGVYESDGSFWVTVIFYG